MKFRYKDDGADLKSHSGSRARMQWCEMRDDKTATDAYRISLHSYDWY